VLTFSSAKDGRVTVVRDPPPKMRSRQKNLTELLARANHLLAESFRAELKAHGLSATEWRVLAALAERDGLPMGDLAQIVLIRQPTLSKATDRMERALLVERRMSPGDRRQSLIYVTARGRQLAAPLLASARDRELWVAQVLGKAGLQRCSTMLEAIIDRLEEPSWHPSR
jgi:MarR family transcriptional regulator, organic hydroperoxide resistance regulator